MEKQRTTGSKNASLGTEEGEALFLSALPVLFQFPTKEPGRRLRIENPLLIDLGAHKPERASYMYSCYGVLTASLFLERFRRPFRIFFRSHKTKTSENGIFDL